MGGRWKLGILCTLANDGPTRFNQLVEALSPVTPTTLKPVLRTIADWVESHLDNQTQD